MILEGVDYQPIAFLRGFQGIGKQLDPTVNLLEEAKPLLWHTDLGKELVQESTKELLETAWRKMKLVIE